MTLTRKNLNRLVIISSIPLFGVVAAFGIAPDTPLQDVPTQRIIIDLPLLDLSKNDDANIIFWQQERIQKNDSVASLLTRLKINKKDKLSFLHDVRNIKAMRQLVPGKTIHAQTTATGELLTFRYFSGRNKQLLVEKNNSNFIENKSPSNIETQIEMKLGVIKSSLFAATDGANIPDSIAIQIAEIFASDIDFNRDLRKNDHFKVVYELRYSNGEVIGAGRVLAVEFTNKNKNYQAVYFESNDKEKGYYTPDGKNLRRAFLRSPLKFSRISSKFSHSRYHPILKKWRSHKGVDYAARTGTPVRATANGTVSRATRKRGYGNLIVLKHHGPYSTAYAHLSSFAKGLRRGKRINQGDIIGYVGSTGLATGPHLHYEFRVNGIQRNPLSVIMPAAIPLSTKILPVFKKSTKPLIARLNVLRDTNLALLD
ncbi:MAG: peptidase M23 [Nitrosomonadaceae bacterium]|nr:peptidase M23 [Nitrosomonadaceae bacterium]|tara:strand:- start:1921 stop:3198 length:1278 start_codon:yes stop_codon:yes gene_type:complete